MLRMARRSHSGSLELRKWRESQDPRVTQADLGTDLGVSGSYIRRYEIGKQDLPLGLKIKISHRTGIALERLLSREQLAIAKQVALLLDRETSAA